MSAMRRTGVPGTYCPSMSHPIMQTARDYSKRCINKHHEEIVKRGKGPFQQMLKHCVAHWRMDEVQDNIDMWLGRWHVNDRTILLNSIPEAIGNRADLLCKANKAIYRPVIAHAYRAHSLRIYLLKGRIPSI
jgi:hypothetical protein